MSIFLLFLRALSLSFLCSTFALAQDGATLKASDEGQLRFVSALSLWRGNPVELRGNLAFPNGDQAKWPAVILFHGSAGQGYRDRSWSQFFIENGFATFQVDYLIGRGLRQATREGPADPNDVTGSFDYLIQHPRIDSNRVVLMGFSRGGSILLSARSRFAVTEGKQLPMAYIGMYPGCERLRVSPNSPKEPVLIMVGDQDNLSSASVCEDVVQRVRREPGELKVIVLPGATHAFDDDETRTVDWGGLRVPIRADPELAKQAQRQVLAFLKSLSGR